MKFNLKYLIFFCLLSIIFLLYIFYRQFIIWDSTLNEYYYKFYLLPLVLVILGIVFSIISHNIRKYLIISIVSILSSLYLFEFYINFKQKSLFKGTGYDRIMFYKDYLEKEDNNAVVPILPKNYLFKDQLRLFPLSGISNSNTVNCNENGYFSIYKADRYGFNNPDFEWEKTKINYLIFGDSFAHGDCVNRPNDIASIIRNNSNSGVINLGMGGTGPLLQYSILREYLPRNTKNIIWLYHEGNDNQELETEMKDNFLKKYLLDESYTQNLKNVQTLIDLSNKKILKDELNKAKDVTKLVYILDFFKLRKTRAIFKKSEEKTSQIDYEKIEMMFKKMLNLSKKNNSNLIIVYLPEWKRFKIENYNNYNYNKIKNFSSNFDIKFIDVVKVFNNVENPLVYFPNQNFGHYTIDGYKLVVNEILKNTE